MKYMLLIYMSENAMGETEREQCYKDSTQLAQDLQVNGQYLSANPLQPVAMATSVRNVRQTARDRWSVRRNARTARRLFPH